MLKYSTREGPRRQHEQEQLRFKATVTQIDARRKRATRAVKEVTELVKEVQYGTPPKEKPENVFRFMFENWNSLRLWTQPKRVSDINDLIAKYEVDCFLGCETQCDWRFAEEEKKFRNLFGAGEQKRHVVGFNKSGKKIQREQHGGTAAMGWVDSLRMF